MITESKESDIKRVNLVTGGLDFKTVTNVVSKPIEEKLPKPWLILFTGALSLLALMVGMIGYLIWVGVGVWGLNQPVGWGWAIVNFVFWVGIGFRHQMIQLIKTQMLWFKVEFEMVGGI